MLHSRHFLIRERLLKRMVELLRQQRLESAVDKRGFAAARHSAHTGECAQRETEIHLLKVVAGATGKFKPLSVAGTAHLRNIDTQGAVEVTGGESVGAQHLGRSSFKHNFPTLAAGFGTDVHHIIRLKHHVLVMLNHYDGVARVAQTLQRGDKAAVVALMEADTRLVKDIKHVYKLGAELRGQTYALALSARQSGGIAVKGKIAKPHIHQKRQARTDFFQNLAPYGS